MKHVANRKKTVSPLPKKSFTQPKTAKKGSTAAKSSKQTSTKTSKVAAESAPVISTRNAKPKAPSLREEILDVDQRSPVLNGKKKLVGGKSAPPTDKLVANRKTKKSASEISKVKIQKSKPIVAVEKSETVKLNPVKVKSKAAANLEKAKPVKVAPKVSAAKSTVKVTSKQIEIENKQAAQSKAQTLKVEKKKAEKSILKSKTDENGRKFKADISSEKNAAVSVKVKSAKSESEKPNRKPSQTLPASTVEKNVPKALKIELPVLPFVKNRTSKRTSPAAAEILPPKTNRKKTPVAPEIIKAETRKIQAEKIQAAAPVKTASLEKTKPVELPVEVVSAPLPKPRKKKVKPLGAAIFRGKKERYDFQVFPIEGEFEDAAAIFIISRRVTDKNKRAHHRMVCIGQTNSVLNELKKHRKGKCFKQHKANAISVLREENEQQRLKIEADLKSAHTIPCPHA